MADTCYEEVMEICVPSSYFLRSIGVAFDVGKYTYSRILR